MNESQKPELTKLTHPERKRTYKYHDGPDGSLSYENVVAVGIRPSGTHRLETADGKKHIVHTGWRGITLDVDEWTF